MKCIHESYDDIDLSELLERCGIKSLDEEIPEGKFVEFEDIGMLIGEGCDSFEPEVPWCIS